MRILSICLIILFARIVDVSLSTIVTVLTVKSKRVLATVLGFIDVIIWFLVVREALTTSIKSIWIAISYALGYAIGTFIGTTLSNKLINGKVSMQVILDEKNESKINEIRDKGFAVSQVNCTGKDNAKKLMLFIELDKKNINDLKNIINKIDENAFMVINETKYVVNGFFK
ncbi:MAG TPA: DUF2179 domain-containing protein [Candidatus Aphodocola excrementigallinarum]|uniref:DUF2179 domain-containing protein n=1 Tax=Candidatus Aphodocola excrementigallinarum TaxID=2840670 RepID=A0A9D1INX5_9FIRM|nr:DUF2179 domain-containing protein [Candidatus Aphodocola excrementigallinarum]